MSRINYFVTLLAIIPTFAALGIFYLVTLSDIGFSVIGLILAVIGSTFVSSILFTYEFERSERRIPRNEEENIKAESRRILGQRQEQVVPRVQDLLGENQ